MNMDRITARLTVFFEEPFWVAVCERVSGGKLEACKITFGAEPKDYDIHAFLLENGNRLKYGPPVRTKGLTEKITNPKRRQREVGHELQATGVGTKAQQALKLQQEQNKTDRKILNKKRKEEEKDRIFDIKQQKRKEKHKGR